MFPSVPPKGLTGLLFVQFKYIWTISPRPKKLSQRHPPSSLSSLSPSGSPWTSLSWTRVTVRVKATDGVAPRSTTHLITTTTTTTRSTRCLIATPVLWKESWGRCYQDLPPRLLKLQSHAINHTSLCQMQTQATLCWGLFCCPSHSSIFADQSQWLFKIGNSVLSDEALLISRQISNMIALCELCVATRALPGLPTCFKRCHAMLQNALLTPNDVILPS